MSKGERGRQIEPRRREGSWGTIRIGSDSIKRMFWERTAALTLGAKHTFNTHTQTDMHTRERQTHTQSRARRQNRQGPNYG